jgi:hypothetical protein
LKDICIHLNILMNSMFFFKILKLLLIEGYIRFELQSCVTTTLEFHESKFDVSTLKVYALHRHQCRVNSRHNCTPAVKLLVHNGFAGIQKVNLICYFFFIFIFLLHYMVFLFIGDCLAVFVTQTCYFTIIV